VARSRHAPPSSYTDRVVTTGKVPLSVLDLALGAEVMIYPVAHGLDDRITGLERLAAIWV